MSTTQYSSRAPLSSSPSVERRAVARTLALSGIAVSGAWALVYISTGQIAWWGAAPAALVSITLATAVVAWSGRRLTRPVRDLVHEVNGVQAEDTDVPRPCLRAFGHADSAIRHARNYRDELVERLDHRRRARAEAELADAYETEFLTTLSHELRTPLNSILGFAQVLVDEIDGPLNPSQTEDVDMIRASGEHLKDLVDDVLDLAAMQSGRFSLSCKPTDVEPILREVARILEGQRRAKPIEIAVRIEEPLPALATDPRRLRQILMNLGTNALKFTEKGSVTLEAAVEGTYVRLTVRDTGAGIPAKELDTIFGEFTQLGKARSRSGSGLGLAICRRLVELHEGTIRVESVVNRGSAFHVQLPARGRGEAST